MFYSQDKKNVTQFVANEVWKNSLHILQVEVP
jgi:hypothetical protein